VVAVELSGRDDDQLGALPLVLEGQDLRAEIWKKCMLT
jgi:hypothetical protein